ncbi:TPA: hypothetical protein L3597_006269 [Pseudomonas aeruginosa]|uniref:hypothetical protein n=1 Tax=Pseudomonas aeruginosa TaxID=287 RepID=UPI001C3ECAC1|nr:hypothetical protein [Pseudomonas aeruginosa]ELM3811448.1 hypothetical protein [Pseudomonas aeruginosa]MBV5723203.1 hypothetical protein [Pseudomonas aeruginosa]HBN7710723.1 hypothetical protein [Pseudomonas aeruginosa]HBN7750230.1 hypothetical protein [Pseudomonas aeruginosa]
MSKQSHTPGPWEIERYSDGLIQIVGNIRAVSDHEEHVTTVVEAVTRGDEANAKLIVAAPDLLDALVALVECEQTTPELWEAARAAIAKATA